MEFRTSSFQFTSRFSPATDLLSCFADKLGRDAGPQEELGLHVSLLLLLFDLKLLAGRSHGDDVDYFVVCLLGFGLQQSLHLLQPQHQLVAATQGRRTLCGQISRLAFRSTKSSSCVSISLGGWMCPCVSESQNSFL